MRFGKYELKDARGKTVIKIFHSTVPAGKRAYREHHHTEYELSLFKAGRGIYKVGEKIYEFQTGDVFLFGSDEVHCITEIYSDSPFDLLNIHFEPKLLWAGGDSSPLPLLMLFSARSDAFSNKIDGNNPETAQICRLIIETEEEFRLQKTGWELSVKLNIYKALLSLLRNYGYVRKDANRMPSDRMLSQLSSAMNYINDHLSEELSLETIARKATMSRSYFSTIFKKFNGISPWEYITIKRVEMAIELLNNTQMSKLEIAEKCGFGSSANFYKAFAKVTGKAPKDYAAKKAL